MFLFFQLDVVLSKDVAKKLISFVFLMAFVSKLFQGWRWYYKENNSV